MSSWKAAESSSKYRPRSRSPSRYSYGESARTASGSGAHRPVPTSHRFADDAWARRSSHYNDPRRSTRGDDLRSADASHRDSRQGAWDRASYSSSSYAAGGRGRGRGGYGMYGSSSSASYPRAHRVDDRHGSRDDDMRERHTSRSVGSYATSPDRASARNTEPRDRKSPEKARRDKARDEDIEPHPIDWPDVESKARANGLIVPGDIVEEYKRQGHFDLLRRQLLSAYQSSKTSKDETQLAISDLLTSYFQANPYEAAKIAKMGDVRLQHAECMKILEMSDPPRAKIKKWRTEQEGQEGKEDVEVSPLAGPDLMRQLLDRLHSDGGQDGFEGTLSEKGKFGQSLSDHIGQLLKDELKDGERRVAPPAQESGEGSTEAAVSPSRVPCAVSQADHVMA